jgi:hypothetical protein
MALAKSIGGDEAAMRLGMPESHLWNCLKAEAADKAAESALTVRGEGSGAKRGGNGNASQLSSAQIAHNQALAL